MRNVIDLYIELHEFALGDGLWTVCTGTSDGTLRHSRELQRSVHGWSVDCFEAVDTICRLVAGGPLEEIGERLTLGGEGDPRDCVSLPENSIERFDCGMSCLMEAVLFYLRRGIVKLDAAADERFNLVVARFNLSAVAIHGFLRLILDVRAAREEG